MRICKISEILNRAGEQISGVHATLVSVYPRRTGEGKYGPYSFQDGLLKDDSASIIVTFANHPDMTPNKGIKMTATAKESDKGISGLQVKSEEYEGKVKIKLHISGSALVVFGVTPVSGDDPSSPEDATDEEKQALAALAKAREAKAARLQAEAAEKAKATSREMAPPVNGMDYSASKKRIVQTANLYHYALRSAKWALDKHGMEIKDLTTSAATLFLTFVKDGLIDSMPKDLMDEKKAMDDEPELSEASISSEVDQEPRTWKEVVHNGVALGEMEIDELDELFNTFKPKIDPKTGNYSMNDLYVVNAIKEWKKSV